MGIFYRVGFLTHNNAVGVARRVGILAHRNGRIQYNGGMYCFRQPENGKKRVGKDAHPTAVFILIAKFSLIALIVVK